MSINCAHVLQTLAQFLVIGMQGHLGSQCVFWFPITHKRCELHAILGVCLEDLMFHEHLGLFVAELPTATSAVETDLAIEMYFLTATSWAVYILVFRLNHLAALSLTIQCLSSTPDVLSAYQRRECNHGSIS